MSRPFAELPEEVCFTLVEVGELLNLLEWLQDLLATDENPDGHARVSAFIRMTQRRLWGDLQDLVDDEPDDPDDMEEG